MRSTVAVDSAAAAVTGTRVRERGPTFDLGCARVPVDRSAELASWLEGEALLRTREPGT